MLGVIVRPRESTDLAECAEVLREVHESDAYPDRWPDDARSWLQPPHSADAWIAQHDGRVVGHVVLVENLEDFWVSRLFVRPGSRGMGVGEALLECVGAYAGGRPLMLDVIEASTSAISLYERTGWTLVRKQPADWVMADGTRPVQRIYCAPSVVDGSKQ